MFSTATFAGHDVEHSRSLPDRAPAARTRWRFVLPVVALLTLLAWHNRFLQDDAFISLVYARNLAAGAGLVWSTGEVVQGYTNFAWTLLEAAAMRAGLDPIRFLYAAGLACFAGTLCFLHDVARRLLRSRAAALASIVVAGTNYTLSCYATGGLETQMQTMLFVACLAIACALWDDRRMLLGRIFALSLLACLAVMTRMDSVLLVGPVALVAAWLIWKRAAGTDRAAKLAGLILPGLAITAAWLFWTQSYYGDLLPNTFYLKTADISTRTGFVCAARFLGQYALAVFLAGAALLVASKWRQGQRNGPIVCLFALSGLWIAYVIRVGGDFMEFRFLTPIVPILAIIATWFVFELSPAWSVRATLFALLAWVSFIHANLFTGNGIIESIDALKKHLTNDEEGWVRVGEELRRLFPDRSVSLATTAAGAVPYYSELPSVDMLGLNDKWVARHGVTFRFRPGHQRIATYQYLVERGVNLVLGHPSLQDPANLPESFSIRSWNEYARHIKDYSSIPQGASFLAIPITDRLSMVVLYLVPNVEVDRQAAAGHWRKWPIPRTADDTAAP